MSECIILWNYTGPPKFEFGRVEFASGGPGGPPVSKVNVEPCDVKFCEPTR